MGRALSAPCLALGLFFGLGLAACGPDAQSALGSTEAAEPALLSAAGFGPAEVGHGIELARSELGHSRISEIIALDDPPCGLWLIRPDGAGDGLVLMARGGLITRVSDDNERDAVTAEGLGVGSTEAEVRAAYPGAEERPAPYDPTGHDLVVWARPETSGMRFEINAEGVVKAVHVGNGDILLAEGCL